jgi:hypothetical protein
MMYHGDGYYKVEAGIGMRECEGIGNDHRVGFMLGSNLR